ncbi:hypothetical protein CpB1041 [Chlamydia pneumoniae TW-183]|uniref:Uncharacterized protein n=2 Tax=Chlamydia pneumoniae TaxID=83558 RepID=Q9Z6Q6_CHLPN|nr:hypothetical protein [Chlamydia pneumoniae]AAD19140.1 CT846 hypothetical protein [Chlamydia pneumoniae CWL029]AAF38640.1 conserved hypothetical protein [Chlamydia pneumoniae AR39]AAP98970.1 hypothetical protein CpB1041 [Chlamydia pneumoniae TW-183]CRI33545.1 Uncharacterized protein BN1224_Wien1_A_10520 [Chlamydia pneumoniae]CRI36410.1 Uncharacterized protein BN1224_CM1_A_10570 [Chlamydia pneumoniae]
MRVIFPDKHNNFPNLSKLLKKLPSVILVTSCIAPFFSYIINKFFGIPGLLEILALSVKGIQKHHFWQFLTYPLITADSLSLNKDQSFEITQRLLLRNVLDFFLFYKAIQHLIRKLGAFSVLVVISGQALIIGAVLWGFMALIHSSQSFFGPESIICGVLTVQIFLDPEKRFTIGPTPLSVSIKWGFLFVLGFYCCILIFSGAFLLLLASMLAIVLAILFCKKEKIPNPYTTSLRF